MFSENLLLFFILLTYLNVYAEILHDTIHEGNDEHDHSNHENHHEYRTEIEKNQIDRKNLVKKLIKITRPESQRKQEFLQIHDLKNVLTSLDIYDCNLMGENLCKAVSNVIS